MPGYPCCCESSTANCPGCSGTPPDTVLVEVPSLNPYAFCTGCTNYAGTYSLTRVDSTGACTWTARYSNPAACPGAPFTPGLYLDLTLAITTLDIRFMMDVGTTGIFNNVASWRKSITPPIDCMFSDYRLDPWTANLCTATATTTQVKLNAA